MGDIDYCTVLPSWEFDKDPACVVSYAFGKENEKSQVEDSGEGVPEKYNPSNSLILQCQCDDMGEREPCMISVTCKPQYRISVTGIHVVSESKTLEIYDTGEIYLTTVKGRQLQVSTDREDQPPHSLYRCKTNIKESLYGLSVKFLSFGEKSTLTIYSILLILKPELDGFSPEKEEATGRQINIDKVKDFLHDMGDTIPDGARNLLQSMEDYQMNQKSAMSGLQGLMTSGPPSGDKFGMMGLMSILSQATSTTGSAGQSNIRTNRQTSSVNGSQNTNSLSTNNTVNTSDQRGNIGNFSYSNTADRENQRVSCENNKETGDRSDMFKMLQNICGKVTRIREDEKKTEETMNNSVLYDESGEVISVPCPNRVRETKATDLAHDSSLMEVEQRLKEHIDKQIVKIEEKLSEKLDKMLSMLSVVLESTKSKETLDNSSQTLNFEDGIDES